MKMITDSKNKNEENVIFFFIDVNYPDSSKYIFF